MALNTIRDFPEARQKRKIVGRGIASGWGKTCGKGGKGQTVRSGGSIDGFEGGQTPLYRRLPKRGFKNTAFQAFIVEVDFKRLNRWAEAGKIVVDSVIDLPTLKKAGFLPKACEGLSLLNNGTPDKAYKLAVTRATKSAVAALQAAGGSVAFE